MSRPPHLLDRPRTRPHALQAALAAAFVLVAPVAVASGSWTVDSCDDTLNGSEANHTGTLRFVLSKAASGDFIYLQQLSCSKISLGMGALAVPQNNLTLFGPGTDQLIITGKYQKDRIFNHTGTGTLELRDLTIDAGYQYSSAGSPRGGCVASNGSVELYRSGAFECTVKSPNHDALGGAIYAKADVSVRKGSIVKNNVADGGFEGGRGGGIYAKGSVLVEYSTVADNDALGDLPNGGGVVGISGGTIKGSTISGNHSDFNIGGVSFGNSLNRYGNTVSVVNSTISGNSAGFSVGGMFADAGSIDVRNSTIAFNTADNIFQFDAAAGLALITPALTTVTVDSSIIANNTYKGKATDLSTTSYGTLVIGGSNNVIPAPANPVPPDTNSGCPLLGPLRDNGGLTRTHAVLSGSPAVDHGHSNGRPGDQRGTSALNGLGIDYPRVSGVAADIGAYEVQQDEIVFTAGFDGCPAL